jgi:hypothetical protein
MFLSPTDCLFREAGQSLVFPLARLLPIKSGDAAPDLSLISQSSTLFFLMLLPIGRVIGKERHFSALVQV